MGEIEEIKRILGLTFSHVKWVQIPDRSPREMQVCGAWRVPWACRGADTSASTEDETLTAGSS